MSRQTQHPWAGWGADGEGGPGVHQPGPKGKGWQGEELRRDPGQGVGAGA